MGLDYLTLRFHKTLKSQKLIPHLTSERVWLGTVPSSQVLVFFYEIQQIYITKSVFFAMYFTAWIYIWCIFSGVLEPEELLQTMSSGVTGNAVNLLGHEEEILLPSESLEPKRTRKFDSCSFRKSLAWDNAFYTSSGMSSLVGSRYTLACYQHLELYIFLVWYLFVLRGFGSWGIVYSKQRIQDMWVTSTSWDQRSLEVCWVNLYNR